MQQFLIKLLILCCLALLPLHHALAVDVEEQTITRTDWPRYANGASLSALPQTRQILQRFEEGGDMRIHIRYPGGEQGIKWGQEMLRWFVAYGVPGKYLQLQLGSGAADQLVLVLVDRG